MQDMGMQANQRDTENLKIPEVSGDRLGKEKLWESKFDKNYVSGFGRCFRPLYAKKTVSFIFPCHTMYQHGGCAE